MPTFAHLLGETRGFGDAGCETPLTGEDPTTEYGLTFIQFKNHKIYFLVSDPATTVESCLITVAQKAWIDAGLAQYAVAQGYLQSLPALTGAAALAEGNYCIHFDTFGATYMLWPVASTYAVCGASATALKYCTIPANKYSEVADAFHEMDCVQTYLRSFLA